VIPESASGDRPRNFRDSVLIEALAAAADGPMLLGALLALEEALQTHFRGTVVD
jgi:hypothetical protein